MFEFIWPWMWVLTPAPLLVFFLAPRAESQESAIRVPFFATLAGFEHNRRVSGGKTVFQKVLLTLLWLSVVAAAARPVWVGDAVQLPAAGRDLLMAVDISGSMKTPDMKIDDRQLQRIDVVKYVVSDFVKRRESDRLGLILFGSQAYLQSPLTFDKATIEKLLMEAQLGFAGQQTAIGDAIGLAIKRLRQRPEASRVLILLTDGANTAGEVDPRQAADLAKLAGIKIYTIGVGADQMVQDGFFGKRVINPSADLDEGTLNYIAEQTGGRYFRARNPQELIQIYKLLDELEPVEQNDEVYRPVNSLYYWPLAAFLLLSLLLAATFIRLDTLNEGVSETND